MIMKGYKQCEEDTFDMVPLLANKCHEQPSMFDPAILLREARRQKSLPAGAVPEISVLDPDGDLFRHIRDSGARRNPYWACYHTELYDLALEGLTVGIVGCAVGASFAVMVAEELFASGCRLLLSVTSAGQIVPAGNPPYFVLIDRALRDEGTSYHYLPPARYARIRPDTLATAQTISSETVPIVCGGAWTTDAPFRETSEAVAFARSENLLAVEMEAAALYAFAEAKGKSVLCFAHVTNRMGLVENDFDKGDSQGNKAFMKLIAQVAQAWRSRR
jgi:uridine phosphorylase